MISKRHQKSHGQAVLRHLQLLVRRPHRRRRAPGGGQARVGYQLRPLRGVQPPHGHQLRQPAGVGPRHDRGVVEQRGGVLAEHAQGDPGRRGDVQGAEVEGGGGPVGDGGRGQDGRRAGVRGGDGEAGGQEGPARAGSHEQAQRAGESAGSAILATRCVVRSRLTDLLLSFFAAADSDSDSQSDEGELFSCWGPAQMLLIRRGRFDP